MDKSQTNNKEILSIDISEGWFISITSNYSFSRHCTKAGNEYFFCGQGKESKNKKFILAWNDSYEEEMGPNSVKTIGGVYLLLENKRLVFSGDMQRPDNGKVADNGAFILNDFSGYSSLESDFFAFNNKGMQIINKHYSALLSSNYLSDDGKYSLCQTGSSPTQDSQTVSLFDLETGKIVWQIKPETGVADSFDINYHEEIITFSYEGIGEFKYSLQGIFLDKEKWEQKCIESGTGYDLMDMANEKLMTLAESKSPYNFGEVINLYLLAIDRIDSDYYLSIAHKKIGALYEQINDKEKAIIHYEKAYGYRKNVGVIKKLQELKQAGK